jgi:Ca2+-binding RTX toxin-like protein
MLKAVRGNFAVEFYGDDVVNNLIGTAQADTLSGGGGNDRLTGGRGEDTLSGGTGADKFMFKPGEISGDIIMDFDGNGAGVGDTLNFNGFGPGASLSNVGETWTISYGAGLTETFYMNVTSLAPGDVIFG